MQAFTYTSLSRVTEIEYNSDCEKIKVTYWAITDTRTNKEITRAAIGSKNGRRIAAIRIIQEDLIAEAEAGWDNLIKKMDR